MHPRQSKSPIYFEEIGEIWTVGAVIQVDLACVLRVTTEKRSTFRGRKVRPQRKSWLRLCIAVRMHNAFCVNRYNVRCFVKCSVR